MRHFIVMCDSNDADYITFFPIWLIVRFINVSIENQKRRRKND